MVSQSWVGAFIRGTRCPELCPWWADGQELAALFLQLHSLGLSPFKCVRMRTESQLSFVAVFLGLGFTIRLLLGFPRGASGKERTCQCRRREMRVQSLGQEDPSEEGMALYSSLLAWRIPWTEELQSTRSQRVGHD